MGPVTVLCMARLNVRPVLEKHSTMIVCIGTIVFDLGFHSHRGVVLTCCVQTEQLASETAAGIISSPG